MEDIINQLKKEITNLQKENSNLKNVNFELIKKNEQLQNQLAEAINDTEKKKEDISLVLKNDSSFVSDELLQKPKNSTELSSVELIDLSNSQDEVTSCNSLNTSLKTLKNNENIKRTKRSDSLRNFRENKEQIREEKFKKIKDEEKEKKKLELEVQKKTREEEKKLKEKEKERRRLELEAQKKAKEEERKTKEEEKERKRLEFETQKKAKELEIERKRLEEEQKKEQKRRQEEELEEKKRRQSQKFIKFFHKIEKSEGPLFLPTSMSNPRFQPFQIKEGVILAPILVRKPFTKEEKENFLKSENFQIEKSDYLLLLEKKSQEKKIALQNKKTNDVEPVINGSRVISFVDKRPKMKLFQFFENVRPPYYGTWRRRSAAITGRRPFSTDEKSLNYDYDSEEDWENEPSDAEECNSDEEDDLKDEEDDTEENDGFFVEHGYLSAGEGSEGFSNDENEKNDNISTLVSNRKHRLAQRAEEWKNSLKQKHKTFRKCQLVTAIFGPSWKDEIENGQNLPVHFETMRIPSVIIPYENLVKSKEVKEEDKLILKKVQKKINV